MGSINMVNMVNPFMLVNNNLNNGLNSVPIQPLHMPANLTYGPINTMNNLSTINNTIYNKPQTMGYIIPPNILSIPSIPNIQSINNSTMNVSSITNTLPSIPQNNLNTNTVNGTNINNTNAINISNISNISNVSNQNVKQE